MEYFYMIFRSLRQSKWRNVLAVVQLFIGFFIIFQAFCRLNYTLQSTTRASDIIEPNTFKLYMHPKGSIFSGNVGVDDAFKKNTEGNHDELFAPEGLQVSNDMLSKDSRVEAIGKMNTLYAPIDEKNKDLIKVGYKYIKLDLIDRETVDIMNYKVSKGISFREYYKSSKQDDTIPILIGPPLEKNNPIGSVVELPGCHEKDNEDKALKFKVIGVLDPTMPTLEDDGFYLSPSNNGYVVIVPQLCLYDGLGLNYQTILVRLKNMNDRQAIEKELNSRSKLCDIGVQNESDLIGWTKKNSITDFRWGVYMILVLLLASFGIISTSLMALLNRKKELGIRTVIGAKKKGIVLMMAGELAIQFLAAGGLSLIIVYIISRRSSEMLFDARALAYSCGIILFFMMVSTIPLIVSLFKRSPRELISER